MPTTTRRHTLTLAVPGGACHEVLTPGTARASSVVAECTAASTVDGRRPPLARGLRSGTAWPRRRGPGANPLPSAPAPVCGPTTARTSTGASPATRRAPSPTGSRTTRSPSSSPGPTPWSTRTPATWSRPWSRSRCTTPAPPKPGRASWPARTGSATSSARSRARTGPSAVPPARPRPRPAFPRSSPRRAGAAWSSGPPSTRTSAGSTASSPRSP
jgi:hypothetical protein